MYPGKPQGDSPIHPLAWLKVERLVILNSDEDVEQLEPSHTFLVCIYIQMFKANSHVSHAKEHISIISKIEIYFHDALTFPLSLSTNLDE